MYFYKMLDCWISSEWDDNELLGHSGDVVVEIDCGWIGGNKRAAGGN